MSFRRNVRSLGLGLVSTGPGVPGFTQFGQRRFQGQMGSHPVIARRKAQP